MSRNNVEEVNLDDDHGGGGRGGGGGGGGGSVSFQNNYSGYEMTL